MGIWLAKSLTLDKKGDFVRERTNQTVAMRCIHMPVMEKTWLLMKSRKLRE